MYRFQPECPTTVIPRWIIGRRVVAGATLSDAEAAKLRERYGDAIVQAAEAPAPEKAPAQVYVEVQRPLVEAQEAQAAQEAAARMHAEAMEIAASPVLPESLDGVPVVKIARQLGYQGKTRRDDAETYLRGLPARDVLEAMED